MYKRAITIILEGPMDDVSEAINDLSANIDDYLEDTDLDISYSVQIEDDFDLLEE